MPLYQVTWWNPDNKQLGGIQTATSSPLVVEAATADAACRSVAAQYPNMDGAQKMKFGVITMTEKP